MVVRDVKLGWVGLLALSLVACGDSEASRDTSGDDTPDVSGETQDTPDAEADGDPADAPDMGDVPDDAGPDASPDSGDDTTADAEDVAPDSTEDALEDAADDTTDDTTDVAGDDATADVAEDVAPDTTEPTTCAQLGASTCLVNSNCAVGETCQPPEPGSGVGCCLPGAPGEGQVGVPCAQDADCAFGKCLSRDDGAKFCSGDCGSDLDCPGFMLCSDLFGWCYPKDSDWQPSTCAEASLDQCFYNDNCDDADRCEDIGAAPTELLCCTPGPRGTAPTGAPCAAHTDCAFGRCLGGQCSDLCAPGADPCPAAGMACNDLKGLCEPL